MSNDQFALLDGYIDGPSGDLRLRADASATVPLAAMPGWAWAPVDQFEQDGQPFAACPRAFARRMAEGFEMRGHPLALGAGLEQDARGGDPAERRGELRTAGRNPLVTNRPVELTTTEVALAFV